MHACTQVTYLPRRETLETCVHAFPADRWDLLTFWNDAFPRRIANGPGGRNPAAGSAVKASLDDLR